MTHTERIEELLNGLADVQGDLKEMEASRIAIFSEETLENAKARERSGSSIEIMANEFRSADAGRKSAAEAFVNDQKHRATVIEYNVRVEERDMARMVEAVRQTVAMESIADSLRALVARPL